MIINSIGDIFAGTGDINGGTNSIGGVFRSTNNGDSWVAINNGLTNTYIYSLAINDSGNIFCGTWGGSVFRSIQSTITDGTKEVNTGTPTEYSLQQNYPNPFNQSTIISYQLPSAEFVNLKIYDVLGREVTMLVNEEKPAGVYQVTFDASEYNLSSGIYFYRLTTIIFAETKKLILQK